VDFDESKDVRAMPKKQVLKVDKSRVKSGGSILGKKRLRSKKDD
jgi:putative protein kinase ArgK-like GTPase of G3E family